MVDKKQELLNQIKDLEEKEQLDKLQKELQSVKEQFEGKCFGTNYFERNTKASHLAAVYYKEFKIVNNAIELEELSISRSKNTAYKKSSIYTYTYQRNHFIRTVYSLDFKDNYNAHYHVYNGYSYMRKEISVEKFEELWNICEVQDLEIEKAFNGKVNKTDLLRIGTDNDEKTIQTGYNQMGIKFIDLLDNKYNDLANELRYAKLPMLQEQRFIPEYYFKDVLKYYKKTLEDNINSVFSTAKGREYDRKRIEIVNKYL